MKNRLTLEHTLHHAQELLQTGRLAESAAAFQEVVKQEPSCAAGWYGIGLVHLKVRDFTKAEWAFESTLRWDPDEANALFYLGEIAEVRGDSNKATGFYRRTLRVKPTHVGALQRLKHLDKASNSGSSFRTVEPNSPIKLNRSVGAYEFLEEDNSPLSRQVVEVLRELQMTKKPRLIAYLGTYLHVPALLLLFILFIFTLVILSWNTDFPTEMIPFCALVASVFVSVLFFEILYLALRAASTAVTICNGRLQMRTGIFAKKYVNVELWRVYNIEMRQTLMNRFTGDGSLILTLNDKSQVEILGIAHGDQLVELRDRLLNIVFLLRSHPVIKGIVS